jgi:hypothetical protein
MPALVVFPAGDGDLQSGDMAILNEDEGTGRLWVDAAAPVEDQLWVIEEAARYLRTGDPGASRRDRHLRAVP